MSQAKLNSIYPFLDDEAIYKALRREIEYFKLSPFVKHVFLTSKWGKWQYSYDGATLVQDKYHPRIANWLHDYMWRTGAGGYKSDVIYKYLLIKTGTSSFIAQKRFVAIRSAWLFNYKWSHKRKGNVRPLTDDEENLYLIAKSYLSK